MQKVTQVPIPPGGRFVVEGVKVDGETGKGVFGAVDYRRNVPDGDSRRFRLCSTLGRAWTAYRSPALSVEGNPGGFG